MFELETQIRSWSDYLRSRGNLLESDLEELESHLRDEIDDLVQGGLSPDEAFLISVKRIGNTDLLSREFAKVNADQLWRQLVVEPLSPENTARNRTEILLVVALALIAGTLAKIPELFGIHLYGGGEVFYFKNLALFAFPAIVVYFIWKQGLSDTRTLLMFSVAFVSAVVAVNLYPSHPPGHTQILAGIHLPIVLWLVVGIAYTGNRWNDTGRRMDFVRFTGEAFIYSVLILCGGFVLVGFTNVIFFAIDVDASVFSRDYLVVYGGLGSLIVATYLVEAKKSIIENLAPVLARIFSPLFLLVMLSFLGVMVFLGKSPYTERDFLIGFDLMLVLVLGLVLYTISSRPQEEKPGLFDIINLVLIATALVVDIIALSAILTRLSSYGITPNKMAALGENIVLLVNLAGLAFLYVRFLTKREGFPMLERWQTAYLPVYALWASVVVLIFPIVFGFK
jgi:hypothetical protein